MPKSKPKNAQEKKQEEIIRRIRARFSHIPEGVSLAEELIAERRAEARREEEELSKRHS